MKRMLTVTTMLLLATAAYAHGTDRGKNGGRQVDAGDYHVEMVAKDTSLSIYVNDKNDRPVDAKGMAATGIFVVSGKPHRVELKPEIANKLTGTAAVSLPTDLKGAVQITLPSGATVQAKYQ
ncbi:MAG TPA: hypothetical protein VG900_06025 [Hyphomicrobiaceae bacterium]|nr:hypothetical protein [Hyphomicrobiaceae bacterium]